MESVYPPQFVARNGLIKVPIADDGTMGCPRTA